VGVVGKCFDVGPGVHELTVEAFDDLGMLEYHLGHECPGFADTAAFALEEVALPRK